MRLIGRVETAKPSIYGDSIEIAVTDKEVVKSGGTGRPQYTCRIVRGLPGLDVLRQMRKDGVSQQELVDYALGNVQLPQEDDLLTLIVTDVTGKGTFKTLVCEVEAIA